ncbi:MAG TPA: sugar phosphate isomerase/epimerase, partial [Terriglobia bacterium]|nr:sugar phosphate isomerase/epimerase [Terriglobia bacterium]
MLTRRQFLEKTICGVSGAAAISAAESWGAGHLAWPKPIGLELYTVRDEFARDPAGTLKKVGATGYREVEASTEIPAETLKAYLRAANLTAP